MVPKVGNGTITLDGALTPAEYGGFAGVTVEPGVNAWILDWPEDRTWDGPDDSSFTYWLAHDDNYFYVAALVKDEVVTSDDPNGAFWKDDSIEIVIDALADRFDNNTDNSQDAYGGHSYLNFQGKFSAWDDTTGQITTQTWSTEVPWTYGTNGDVFGFGKPVAGGWALEVRFKKSLFENPTAGNRLRNGYRMGFNIGLDDDDKRGPGTAGDASRTQDLELQYFWSNRERRQGLNADYLASLTPEQKDSKTYLTDLPLVLDGDGRLSHGGSGEIFFGYDPDPTTAGKNILFVLSNAESPVNADAALIAILEARGYTVTRFATTGTTPPDDLRAAAAGKNLVFISESIGSTTVVDPVGIGTGVFSLKDTDVPIISFEAYMFDNADWVTRTEDGSNDFINWGNTGRSDLVNEALHDARDSLYIQKPGHPIVGSLTGKVKVYDPYYSFTFGIPSADADVIASVQPDGSYPTLFVYEKGDKLVDGSIAPNKRIGLFLGQPAAPNANTPTDYADLNEAGRTLFLNTVAYAIGATTPVKPTLAYTTGPGTLVLTYSGGTLQSTSGLTGTWSPVAQPSPVTIQTSVGAGPLYYRVHNSN